MTPFFTVVILTMQGAGTPHAAALLASNPDVDIRIRTSPAPGGAEGKEIWKNCDRIIREWWREHRETVTTPEVLFLEWDVICDVDLCAVLSPAQDRVGLRGAAILSPIQDRQWPAFAELPRLPRKIRAHAIGLVPSAALLFRREALDAIADPKWDIVYQTDILSELRTGTLVRASGWKVTMEPAFSQVGVQPIQPSTITEPGIYHPVKSSLNA